MVSGFGAVPEGFIRARALDTQSDLTEARARELQLEQLAGQIAGAALFSGGGMPGAVPMPPQGPPPQPPMPGEASMPPQPPQMAAADPNTPFGERFGAWDQTRSPSGRLSAFAPSPAGSATGAPTGTGGPPPASSMPPGAAAGGGMPQQPQLSLEGAIARIDRATPNLPPALKMRALERMTPLLDQQAKQQLAQLGMQFRERQQQEQERHNRAIEGGGPGGQGLMSPAAIDAAAERYLKTGAMPPNLGRGVQGRNDMANIQNRAAELAQERGIKMEDLPKQWQTFKSEQIALQRFMSGPQGNTVRSLGVVVDHLSTMRELTTALDNKDLQAFNRIAQAWAEQTGQAAPTNLATAAQIVGAEVIKALGVAGAGTKEERQEAANAFSRAKSPEQLAGAITVAQKLLAGQLGGLRRQFKTATGLGPEKFDEMLGPEAMKFLEGDKSGSKGGTSSNPVVTAPGGWTIQRVPDEPSESRGTGSRTMSDEQPDPIRTGSQYAMDWRKRGNPEFGGADIERAAGFGLSARGGVQKFPDMTRFNPNLVGSIEKFMPRYYKPGNIVPAYGGSWDKVLEFRPGIAPGDFRVKVQEVTRDGAPIGSPRWHSTVPTAQQMKQVLGE